MYKLALCQACGTQIIGHEDMGCVDTLMDTVTAQSEEITKLKGLLEEASNELQWCSSQSFEVVEFDVQAEMKQLIEACKNAIGV